jgi:D-alanine-D-alanine ligase-like ATP-grasp enzyme
MNIVLTYDPRWEYKPENITPYWASLDTVDYIVGLLEDLGYNTLLVRADDGFEYNLREIKNSHPNSLVFWLNEFMPTIYKVDRFTVSIIEKVGMMHTGTCSAVLGVGLDKEATKNVFRKLGLSTPESVVVYPGDYSPIFQGVYWDDFVIIKPLLQGGSNGIDQFSVLYAKDTDLIRAKVEEIHFRFNEPALIEKYIGGNDVREFSVPILISNTGKIAELPIIEIDLGQISGLNGKYQFLTQAFKQEKRANSKTINEKGYLKIPADLPLETLRRIYSDVGRIVKEIGCKDMIRTDIRADSTGLYYLEVNVNPGKNKFSYLLMSAYFLGLDYSQIIGFIPYQALLRYGLEPSRKLKQLVKPVKDLFETHEVLEMIF